MVVDIGIPDKIEDRSNIIGIDIERRWLSGKTYLFTLFAIVWDVFMINWYNMAFKSANTMEILFPIIHVVVGISLTYFVIASWFNRTRIIADRESVIVRHGPVPWTGNIELSPRDIRQVYAKQKESRYDNGISYSYEVRAITNDGRNILFVGMLESSEQAIYVQQKLQKFLKIEPELVPGAIY